MSKRLVALLVSIGIGGLAHAGNFMDIPPGEGLPTCAGVYATLAAYASPQDRPVLIQRSTTIAVASNRYNPNGMQDALDMARSNISRINAGDKTTAELVAKAEQNCRAYTARYGI